LKVDFKGSWLTSDGCLIVVRELDQRLGLGDLIAQHLTDSRREEKTRLPLADMLRQSVYRRPAGHEDVNDAERLSREPTFRLIGSEKTWEQGAARTFRLQSFETKTMAEDKNFAGLSAVNPELTAMAEAIDSPQRVLAKVEFHTGESCPRVGFIVTWKRTVRRWYGSITSAERRSNGSKQASRR
jgi:hypothetical protein